MTSFHFIKYCWTSSQYGLPTLYKLPQSELYA
jgi:hypothetical protein